MADPELKLVISADADDAMRKLALLKTQLEELKKTMQGNAGVTQAGKEVEKIGKSVVGPVAKKFDDIAGGLKSAELVGAGLSLAADVGILAAVSTAQEKAASLKTDVDSMKSAVSGMLSDMSEISASMADVDRWATIPAEKVVSVKLSFSSIATAETETGSFSDRFKAEFDAIRAHWSTFKTDASSAVTWFGKNIAASIIGHLAAVSAAAVAAGQALSSLSSAAPDMPTTKQLIDKSIEDYIRNAPTGTWGHHRFASGGFPTIGEMFIAREAGPELVGQIGHRTAVANNDQIIQGVAGGVAAGQVDGIRVLNRIAGILDGISRKPLTAEVRPSSGLGAVVRRSMELDATNTGYTSW